MKMTRKSSVILGLPILPGQGEAWRRFYQELLTLRSTALARWEQDFGIIRLDAWVVSAGATEVAVVAVELTQPSRSWTEIGTSGEPFASWLRRQLLQLHGLDLSEVVTKWQFQPLNRGVW